MQSVCVCAGLTYCAMFQAFQEAVTEVVLLSAKTEAEELSSQCCGNSRVTAVAQA